MSKFPLVSAIVICFGISPVAFGQHILACRGTDQVLIGASAVFRMQEGETYPVTGISGNGNLMFATPFGGADFHGDRFRVLSGGQYANVEVTLQHIRSSVSGSAANWQGVVTNTAIQPVGQCYAALQWYYDGQPFSTVAKIIGTLDPGRAVAIALSTAINQREGDRGGSYSFHIWSGPAELKQKKIEEPEW